MPTPKRYRVYWSFKSNEDLADIYAYIEQDSPAAAEKVIDTLLDLGNSLETFPERFPREWNLADAPLVFRFIPKWNYKIIYIIKETEDMVIIARIFSASQDPESLSI
ncbi:MAG: type II toxin-antitoxin system RelE/ParE family toxin [Saprospiraceae bacterium]